MSTPAEEHQKITEIAQRIYEEEGRPEGREQDHWYRAEQMYREQGFQQAVAQGGSPPPEASGEDF